MPFQLVVNVPAGLAAPTVLYVQAAGFDAATGFGNFSNRLIVAIQ